MREPRTGGGCLGVRAVTAGVIGVAAVAVWLLESRTEPSGQPAAAAALPRWSDARAYGQLPLAYESNQGQFDAAVAFAARIAGGRLLLLANQAVWCTRGGSLRMTWEGARTAVPEGTDRLPGFANYFLGADSSRWRTRVPTYASVLYRDVWPGVDLAFHGGRRGG